MSDLFPEFKTRKLTLWERFRLFFKPMIWTHDPACPFWMLGFKQMDGKIYCLKEKWVWDIGR